MGAGADDRAVAEAGGFCGGLHLRDAARGHGTLAGHFADGIGAHLLGPSAVPPPQHCASARFMPRMLLTRLAAGLLFALLFNAVALRADKYDDLRRKWLDKNVQRRSCTSL